MESFWRDRLDADDIVLIDGGTGSELQRRGVAMTGAAWSGGAAYSHPDVLREIHADYIRAGAEVVTTNTFGTARFVLEAAGLGDDFATVNRRAVDAALAARDDAAVGPVAVAGSISCMPPNNDVSQYPAESVERDGYRELAQALAEGGVDLIALEMMEDTVHSVMAMEAALETGLPVWLGVSCRAADDGTSLVGFDFPDTPFAEPLRALLPYEPDVVNVMHTDPEAVDPAFDELRTHWTGPVGVYPELGDFQAPNWNFSSRLTPEDFAVKARGWVASGARLLGGCCGTSPDHIRALRDALPALNAARTASS
ncbi:MAG TPA: homocysteine S-methyltransferase family protein [Gammaproteobacteria bacterium]